MLLLVILCAGDAALCAAAISAGGIHLLLVGAVLAGQVSFWIRQYLSWLARDERDERQTWLVLVGLETLLSVALVLRWPWCGMLIAFLGASCNNLAIIANGWRMPVGRPTRDPNYCEITDRTRLPWLSDVLRSGGRWWSIGDLLLGIGVWAFALQLWFTRLEKAA